MLHGHVLCKVQDVLTNLSKQVTGDCCSPNSHQFSPLSCEHSHLGILLRSQERASQLGPTPQELLCGSLGPLGVKLTGVRSPVAMKAFGIGRKLWVAVW